MQPGPIEPAEEPTPEPAARRVEETVQGLVRQRKRQAPVARAYAKEQQPAGVPFAQKRSEFDSQPGQVRAAVPERAPARGRA